MKLRFLVIFGLISVLVLVNVVGAYNIYNFTHLPNAIPTNINVNYGDIHQVAYSPNGDYVSLNTANNFTILKRSGDTYTDLGNPDIGNLSEYVESAWSPDSTYLVAGSTTNNFSFFKRSGDTFTKLGNVSVPYKLDFYMESTMAWSPDGTHLLCGIQGGHGVALFNRSGDTLTQVPDDGGIVDQVGDAMGSIAYSPDGEHVAITDWDGENVSVWKRNGDTYTLLQRLQDPEQQYLGSITTAKYTPDSKYILAGVYEDHVPNVLVFSRNGDTYTQIPSIDYGWVNNSFHYPATWNVISISISNDGKVVAFGTEYSFEDMSPTLFMFSDGYLYPLDNNTIYIDPDYAESSARYSYAFSPDNTHLIVGSDRYEGYFNSTNVFKYQPSPVANFSYTSTNIGINFTDTSTGSPTGWAWFFGDENYTQSWVQQSASAGWKSRTQFSSVALPDGDLVLMGGWRAARLNDTWKSTDKGVTWTQQNASVGWSAREQFSSVALSDGDIVLMGGDATGSVKVNDTWKSTDKGVIWQLENSSSGWGSRDYHTTVVLPDNSIVLMGGEGESGYLNDTWRSTDEGTTWVRQNASGGWTARTELVSVALPNGNIVLIGGYDDIQGLVNDTWRSTDKGITWQLMNASCSWAQREYFSAIAEPDNSIILMGGEITYPYQNDTWRSTDEGVTWTQLQQKANWSGRSQFTVASLSDGSIVLIGSSGDGFTNETWRMQPVGSSLQNPAHTYTGVGTYNVTLQSYNKGGFDINQQSVNISSPVANFTYSSTNLNVNFTDTSTGSPTGWAWFFGDEPYNQSWVEQNASAGWSARDAFGAVTLPNGHIVIMGGYNGSSLNDVWRSTDKGVTWELMNASASWDENSGFAAVALSDSSIVIIGLGTKSNETWLSIDEGATWTLRNASSFSEGRDYPTAVVLPDDSIVVMGGYGEDTWYLHDVWRSTDAGDTWTLQNASAGWDERQSVAAVALSDGSIVVIGGDNGGGGYKNDTWLSTDQGITWTLQNASAGWRGMTDTVAVTLPDDSIVYLGGDGFNYNNDTYRSTDKGATWTQLPTPAWQKRVYHNAVVLPDASIVLMGGFNNTYSYKRDVWRLNPVGSSLQNPTHTYAGAGTYNVTLQVYNALNYNRTRQQLTVTEVPGNYTRQDILMSTGYLLSLTFEDAKNFTVIKNVSVLDNYGMNATAVDGTFNYTYPVGDVALIIHAEGYVDRTIQYTMYQDYTGIVLLEPEVPVQQIHQTTYFPHLVRISCMNFLGTPIEDMAVTAVVVESTSPYGWLSDIFGINTNETQIVNTTLSGSTDSDGSIAFLMVENLKYKINFSKPSESINQTNYLYPKEGDYSYIFWSETPPSVSGSVSIVFWNRTNLSDSNYMDLGVKYTDTGNTTDWLRFTVYYENDTVLYTKNATTPNSWNVSYPVLVQKTSAYIWGVRANNTRYPEQIAQAQIIRFGGSPKIPYSLCPETDPDPTNPCMWNKYGALGIIFLVALLFGRATIKYASAIVSLLALFFWYIGWLDYTPLLISTIVFLGIMFYFRYAESESDI